MAGHRFRPAGGGSEGPYQLQYDLQEMMQALVGIVRLQDEMDFGARRAWKILRACGAGRGVWSSRIQSRLAHFD